MNNIETTNGILTINKNGDIIPNVISIRIDKNGKLIKE